MKKIIKKDELILIISVILTLAVIIIFWHFFNRKIYSKAESCIQNICLSYPSNWKLNSENPDPFATQLAELIAPNPSNSGDYQTKIIIEKSNYNAKTPWWDLWQDEKKALQGNGNNFTILEKEPKTLTIDNNTAYRLIFTGKEDKITFKRIRLGIITKTTVYIITYDADINQYRSFESDAQQIMRSIKFSQ